MSEAPTKRPTVAAEIVPLSDEVLEAIREGTGWPEHIPPPPNPATDPEGFRVWYGQWHDEAMAWAIQARSGDPE